MKKFLFGPAGSGKTVRGVEHLGNLMQESSDGILVYVPQRTLAAPYYDLVGRVPGIVPDILTIGGLSRRMVELFWPMMVESAGFDNIFDPPTFLNIETAQYFMAEVVRPLINEGLFGSVTINRNRLYTQILDNLNKAALNGYGLETLGTRLKLGDFGDPEQVQVYQDALTAATAFRSFCLKNNLVDFSLQLEIFTSHLWPSGTLCRSYLDDQYTHLIADNLEETAPVEHDILREWLPNFESALLIYDTDGGYRTFLGADPDSALKLKDACDEQLREDNTFETNEVFERFSGHIATILTQAAVRSLDRLSMDEITDRVFIDQHHFYPEMLDGVVDRITSLVEDEGISPGEIAVLSPYLSDALRYSLSEKLSLRGIKSYSHRPSRSLRDEPVSQALQTLALLAHPEWNLSVSRFDLAYALLQVLDGIDLVRAQLLAESTLSGRKGAGELNRFDSFSFEVRDRISYSIGAKYDRLLDWIEWYMDQDIVPLDQFWSMIFGEVLAQPGFGYHNDLSAGNVAANLIDSARNFRWMNEGLETDSQRVGAAFIQLVQEGVFAAQYLRSWQLPEEESVLLAPAYTFIMRNRAVDYQFWLDISSYGWHQRIFQPLTHPFVLNRNWPIDRYWSDADEVELGNKTLFRLTSGLLRRCRKGIFITLSELSESGYESEGLLLKTLHGVYQNIALGDRA